jgi:hypothetical protein
MTDRCATPPDRAARALKAAHDAGHQPARVRWDILRWLSYCQSAHGASINNPGAFIATRIQENVPCPDWHKPETWSDLSNEINAARREWDPDHESPYEY